MVKNLEKKVNEEWRLERKFPFPSIDTTQAKLKIPLQPFHFTMQYQPRWVHNIYFDTLDLESYYDNVNGNSDRIKTRIRWYQETNKIFSAPNIEFKIKKNKLGLKNIVALPQNFIDQFNPTFLNSIQLKNALTKLTLLHSSKKIIPLFHNFYYREYYISFDKKFRLTLDSKLSYEKLNFDSRPSSIVSSKYSVIELKYELANEKIAFGMQNGFFAPCSKFSKFVEGIEILPNFGHV
jgi:hypothetical protein